jgi:hypothetical protein
MSFYCDLLKPYETVCLAEIPSDGIRVGDLHGDCEDDREFTVLPIHHLLTNELKERLVDEGMRLAYS